MKKWFRYAALILALTFVCAQVSYVQATLTEEEQEANRRKKEEEKQTETETEKASESDGEQETESETEKESETASEETTEAESKEESSEASTQKEEGPLVAIDPGHQGPGFDMSGTEPIGPGSDVMKARLATGTSGCVSGLDEYELNLDVSLKLRDELEKRGYRVIMTRETHEINISNVERCQVANEAGAAILVRIHANGSEDSSVAGALAAAPSAENPYVGSISTSCVNLADTILNAYCEKTGLHNRGLWITDEMTGMNWSQMPVMILEMGFMTNPEDDSYMANADNHQTMVEGIADGIDVYFGRAS